MDLPPCRMKRASSTVQLRTMQFRRSDVWRLQAVHEWGVQLELGLLAALISAGLQASVHGVWKAAGDKLVIRAIIGCVEAVLVLPLLWFVPLPSAQLWGWLLLSVAIHLVYQLILIEAYRNLDFSVAYPLARGMAPVAAAILGVAFLGDRLPHGALVGILLVTSGLVLLTFGVKLRWVGLLSALSAGLLTSVYSVIDAQGARLATNLSTFIVWFFTLEGWVYS